MKNIQELTMMPQHAAAYYKRFEPLKEKAEAIQEMVMVDYLQALEEQLADYISMIDGVNFWQMIPKILGIDAKLTLLEMFLLMDSEMTLSGNEILTLVEKDYRTINQEFFGYHLNEEPNASMIFEVE